MTLVPLICIFMQIFVNATLVPFFLLVWDLLRLALIITYLKLAGPFSDTLPQAWLPMFLYVLCMYYKLFITGAKYSKVYIAIYIVTTSYPPA